MTHTAKGRTARQRRQDRALARRRAELARYVEGDYMTYPHDRESERLLPSQSVIGAKSARRRRQRKKNVAEQDIANLKAKGIK